MKRFFKHIAFISLIVIASMYLFDYIYTAVYNNAIPRNKISYILKGDTQPIDYVFIGSSRVDNCIDVSVIEKATNKSAINLGVQGAKVNDYVLLFDLAIKKQMIKDTVFIQLGYVYNLEGTSNILKSSLMPYIHNKTIDTYIEERDPAYYKLKYVPFYRYMMYDYKIGFREFFASLIGKKVKVDLSNGYDPKYGTVKRQMGGSLPSTIVDRNKGIETINAIAKENNITVIYFMSPVCNAIHNIDFAQKLEKKIPNFKNYAELFGKQDALFYNCTHLNDTGAQLFSTQIAKDIINKNFK